MDMHTLLARYDAPDLRPAVRQDLRDAWDAACDDAETAYCGWSAAEKPAQEQAYYAYVAAADREEAAALRLQRHVEADALLSASSRLNP
jgi:hypothetical protein